MNREIQQRLQWVKLYETPGDERLVCHRCGVFRATLHIPFYSITDWHRNSISDSDQTLIDSDAILHQTSKVLSISGWPSLLCAICYKKSVISGSRHLWTNISQR
ncbi:hypothetical protein D5O23_23120 [Salmonella enterica subsp. enterica]|nr:hypothetical protein [Salmonella enterica subsp. enterica serovar Mokola]